MKQNTKLFNSLEASAYLRVSRDTLRSWGTQGIGPTYYVYPNGTRLYPINSVEEWLAKREAQHMRNREGDK